MAPQTARVALRAPPRSNAVIDSLAWTLQVLALVIVGMALVVGLVYGEIRVELGMVGLGATLFLFARWLQGRSRG